MSLEEMLDFWKDVRSGLIAELEQIPSEQFGFQATPESRSIAGIIRHILNSQEFLISELCRPDTDFKRTPLRELAEKRAQEAHSDGNKEELIESLRATLKSAEVDLRTFGEVALSETMPGQNGKMTSKLGILYMYITHEMYHRGQLTVYQRLLQIEPALTAKVKQFLATRE